MIIDGIVSNVAHVGSGMVGLSVLDWAKKTYIDVAIHPVLDEIKKLYDKSRSEGNDPAHALADVAKQVWNEEDRKRAELLGQVRLSQEIEAQKLRAVRELAPQQHQRTKEIAMEKPTWEQAAKAEELRRVQELKDTRDGHQEALKGIIKGVEKRGNDPVELEEKRRAFEEQCKRELERKMREQQERMDRLELLYKGPPSGRERA